MEEELVSKSAFITHCGLYEFTRMPFGMCFAPATFHRSMEIIVLGLLWKHCFAYLDDVLVCPPSFDDHLHHIEEVFQRLCKAGLCLKTKKCRFLKSSVSYLGHIVSKDGITLILQRPAKLNSTLFLLMWKRVTGFWGLQAIPAILFQSLLRLHHLCTFS
jgi:hypothetical protein